MRLTEKYLITIPGRLLEVKGKKYDKDYAVTYNHKMKKYNITHIQSGTCLVKSGFHKLKDCLENIDSYIIEANSYMVNNPKIIQKFIRRYNQYIKENLVEKLERI